MADRIISFSVAPSDKTGRKEVDKLKAHCKKTGTNFSFLVLKAITQLNKDMNL